MNLNQTAKQERANRARSQQKVRARQPNCVPRARGPALKKRPADILHCAVTLKVDRKRLQYNNTLDRWTDRLTQQRVESTKQRVYINIQNFLNNAYFEYHYHFISKCDQQLLLIRNLPIFFFIFRFEIQI